MFIFFSLWLSCDVVSLRHKECISSWELERKSLFKATAWFCCSVAVSGVCLPPSQSLVWSQTIPSCMVWKIQFHGSQYAMIRSEVATQCFIETPLTNTFIWLCVIVITSDDQDGIAWHKQHLVWHFYVKDLGRGSNLGFPCIILPCTYSCMNQTDTTHKGFKYVSINCILYISKEVPFGEPKHNDSTIQALQLGLVIGSVGIW